MRFSRAQRRRLAIIAPFHFDRGSHREDGAKRRSKEIPPVLVAQVRAALDFYHSFPLSVRVCSTERITQTDPIFGRGPKRGPFRSLLVIVLVGEAKGPISRLSSKNRRCSHVCANGSTDLGGSVVLIWRSINGSSRATAMSTLASVNGRLPQRYKRPRKLFRRLRQSTRSRTRRGQRFLSFSIFGAITCRANQTH